MKLPYLEQSKWPISKDSEERVVNPSSDHELQSHLMDELLEAFEHKNSSRLRESLMALIHSIRDEEQDE